MNILSHKRNINILKIENSFYLRWENYGKISPKRNVYSTEFIFAVSSFHSN